MKTVNTVREFSLEAVSCVFKHDNLRNILLYFDVMDEILILMYKHLYASQIHKLCDL